jgi:hypothetical protein
MSLSLTMDKLEYDKVLRDIKHTTQKVANDVFTKRLAIILTELEQHGIHIDEDQKSIKKGRPKK